MVNPVTILQWLGHPVSITVFIVLTLLTIGLKRQRQQHKLPSTETEIGRRVARKTALISVGLVVGLLTAYAVVAYSLPRDTVSVYSSEQLPSASSGILLVDVSGSIGGKNKIAILRIFDEAIERKLNLGLVLFAGDGYMAWGPNVPAEESLANMRRYFNVGEGGYPAGAEPWELGGGTQTYEGLLDVLAAQNMLAKRGEARPPIILISDLHDIAKSKAMVLEEFGRMRSEGIPVWIINIGATSGTLNPVDTIEAPFVAILGEDAIVKDLSPLSPVSFEGETSGDGISPHASIEVFGAITGIAVLIILLDAFFLPRLPTKKISRRKER